MLRNEGERGHAAERSGRHVRAMPGQGDPPLVEPAYRARSGGARHRARRLITDERGETDLLLLDRAEAKPLRDQPHARGEVTRVVAAFELPQARVAHLGSMSHHAIAWTDSSVS